jgi:thiamine-monophosphate kinase
VATLPVRPGRLVLKSDMLVEKTDVPPGMTYRQAARKSVAMCVSDLAAKGVRPDSYVISLGLRRGVASRRVKELAQGFADATKEWGASLVGGDTSEARELIINCAMVGFAKRIVPRWGARVGELVVTTGYFGDTAAGLKVLVGGARAEQKYKAPFVRRVLMPDPNLEAGLVLAKYLSSSIDSSDGLAMSLHSLAEKSHVGIVLDHLPVAKGVMAFARLNGVSGKDLVLYGGEEYVVVGTIKARLFDRARTEAARVGATLLAIGRTDGHRGRVGLRTRSGEERIERRGWVHLR